jgi:hypothetical protein
MFPVCVIFVTLWGTCVTSLRTLYVVGRLLRAIVCPPGNVYIIRCRADGR